MYKEGASLQVQNFPSLNDVKAHFDLNLNPLKLKSPLIIAMETCLWRIKKIKF